MENNKKILIIGPSWLGDMIMAQALFKTLKNTLPCTIEVIAPEWSLPIVNKMPEVSASLVLPIQHGKLAIAMRYKLGKELRNNNYDQAIVLPNSWKSALIPLFAKIPQRTGWLGEMRWGLLNDIHYLNPTKFPKMMQRYIALAYPKATALPSITPIPSLTADLLAAKNLLTKFNLARPTGKILALCPGAAYGSAKRWPVEHFITLARQKIAQGWYIWLFGSQQDAIITTQICQQLSTNHYNFAGKLTLANTVDLMALTNVVISNDSGLMHMAASLNKYLIALYGPTSPNFTPPFGANSHIITQNLPCSPCHKKTCPLQHQQCMLTITPQQIASLMAKDGW